MNSLSSNPATNAPATSQISGSGPNTQFASLYAGDLNPEVTEAVLYEIFNAVGPVASIRVCRDSASKKSLGYAYINYHSVNDAERALDTLNYSPIKGRACRLMWSQRDPQLRRSGTGNVYVKNLDKSIDNRILYDTFSIFGNILSCKVATDLDGKSLGFGFVHFETDAAANMAIEKTDGNMVGGKTVSVMHFKKRNDRDSGTEINYTNLYVKHLPKAWTDDDIKEKFGKYGEITSTIVQVDAKGRRFAFVNYADSEMAHTAVEALHGTTVKSKEEIEQDRKEKRELKSKTSNVSSKTGDDTEAKNDGLKSKEDDETEENKNEEQRKEGDEEDEQEEDKLYVQRAQSKVERSAELKNKFNPTCLGIAEEERFPGVNLYVKNLAEDVNDDILRDMFTPFGKVLSCKVMTDGSSSRGFGFVSMSTQEEAQKAIAEMHLKLLAGKPLYVGVHEKRDARMERLAQRYCGVSMSSINTQHGGMAGMAGMYGGGIGVGKGGAGALSGGGGYHNTLIGGGNRSANYGQANLYGGVHGQMSHGGYGQAQQTMYYNNTNTIGPRSQGNFGGGIGSGSMRGGPMGRGMAGMSGPPQGFGGPRGRGAPMMAGAVGHQPQPQGNMMNRGFQMQQPGMRVQQQPQQQQQPGYPATNFQQHHGTGLVRPMPLMQQQHALRTLTTQQQIQQQQSLAPQLDGSLAAALAAAPAQQQKQILGERLFASISRIQPELAGKITGMMLEMENSELLILLENEAQLQAKTEEAMQVLHQE